MGVKVRAVPVRLFRGVSEVEMLNEIYLQIAKPMVRRLGTFFGGYLVSVGVASDTATQIATGAVAAVLVAVDLVQSKISRR